MSAASGARTGIGELFEPAAANARRGYWAPAIVLVFGALSILLLAWTLVAADRKTAQNLAASRAVDDLHSAVAYWHLWLEEHLTGDRHVKLERDVGGNQALALDLASMLIRGGERDNGAVIAPLDLPRRAAAEALEAALAGFRALSDERLARPAEAGVGSDLDQKFDQQFYLVKSRVEELRRLDGVHLEEDRAAFRLRVMITVVIWALIVAAALVGLASRERRRQQAEATLRASQRWLATTLSSIGEAVVSTDLAGRVSFMSPMAEKMTGWRWHEASGRPVDEVFRIAGEDGEPAENPVAEVLRSGERVELTHHTATADREGRRCYAIEESAAPIRDEEGRLLGTVMVVRDISQRRRTEKALRQREAELRQAQKMEAVGRLAGGIAHDVNNYLGAIRGYCEVAMMKGESGNALAERMRSAIATADKVSALIRQLLAFSRRQPVQPEIVDLGRVVAGMEGLMKRLLGADLTLDIRSHPGLWPIEIDRSQIEQALVNLLVNARDAMPGGGRIVVATGNVEVDPGWRERHPGAEPGPYVRLAVSDTGCGIPPEVREQIFEPFFTTKSESGSSGLGLATVYAIVSQNGGFLTVASEVGEGARFDLYLPARVGGAPPRSAAAKAEPEIPVAPARVLLVEDNDDVRASTRTLLETLGHQVAVAADGEAALAILDRGEVFDLLVTDVVMPGMSGKELFDRVRRRHGELPCLFISGYADNATLRHGLDPEPVHLLPKPFSAASLGRKIGEILGPAGSGG